MSETKRKVFIIIVLLLVLVFGVGQFFASGNLNTLNQQGANQNSGQTGSTGTNEQPATQVVAYTLPALASSTPVEQGSCFASSIAAPYRSDAWRCSVGNAISDPCFAVPGATGTVVCGENPTLDAAAITTSSPVFVLQLTKPLPKPDIAPGTPPANRAWLVELGDGTVCSPFTGTRPFASTGEVATYACNGKLTGEDMIFGDLISSSTTWTAEVGVLSTATSTYPPPIAASATLPVFAVWQ